MQLCSSKHARIEPLDVDGIDVHFVSSFMRLRVNIDYNLKWNSHIDSICSKANSRIYFLKHLKRNGVGLEDLIHFYHTVIRPVLEYACPVWSTSITYDQSARLELVQKRALSIIFNMSVFENYLQFCLSNGLETLANRRYNLCKKIFFHVF